MKKILISCAVGASALLSGCSSLNEALAERRETVEIYQIVDIQTQASPDTVIKAAADGLARNTNSVVQNRPLMMGSGATAVPEKPGRFTLVDAAAAFQGTSMGNLMSLANGAGTSAFRVAKCDGAIWTSKATRNIAGSDNLNLYSCLYRYKAGYHLDVYAVFQKRSGGISGITRDVTAKMVGTPEQWVAKTFADTLRSIEASPAKVVILEGQPQLDSLPEIDKLVSR